MCRLFPSLFSNDLCVGCLLTRLAVLGRAAQVVCGTFKKLAFLGRMGFICHLRCLCPRTDGFSAAAV